MFGSQANGQATVQQCFRKLQVWSIGKHIETWSNQDLAGYFTSVPKAKLLERARHNIQSYCSKYNTDNSRIFRIYIGKSKKPAEKAHDINDSQHIKMRLRQVLDAIQFGLLYSYFAVDKSVFVQQRGCCTCNPMSPMICEGSIQAN